jgi:hypothetical protein
MSRAKILAQMPFATTPRQGGAHIIHFRPRSPRRNVGEPWPLGLNEGLLKGIWASNKMAIACIFGETPRQNKTRIKPISTYGFPIFGLVLIKINRGA